MASRQKVPVVWKPADLGLDPSKVGAAGHTKMLKLFKPVYEGKCEIVTGKTPEEAAVNLALKMREAKLL
jgi:electron transfer flavoprotein alpha/beta subunit